jgi:hypothetical protein
MLEAAMRAGHWPTLAESRGKVIFLMDQKNAGPVYAAGHPLCKAACFSQIPTRASPTPLLWKKTKAARS